MSADTSLDISMKKIPSNTKMNTPRPFFAPEQNSHTQIFIDDSVDIPEVLEPEDPNEKDDTYMLLMLALQTPFVHNKHYQHGVKDGKDAAAGPSNWNQNLDGHLEEKNSPEENQGITFSVEKYFLNSIKQGTPPFDHLADDDHDADTVMEIDAITTVEEKNVLLNENIANTLQSYNYHALMPSCCLCKKSPCPIRDKCLGEKLIYPCISEPRQIIPEPLQPTLQENIRNWQQAQDTQGSQYWMKYVESAPLTVSRCPEGSIKEHRSNDPFGSMHPQMRGLIAPVPIRPVGPCHQLEYITSSELASYQQRANPLHYVEHSRTGPGLLYMESAPSTVSRCPEGSIKEHQSNDSFGSMHPEMRGLIAPVPIRPVGPSHQLEYITSSELASYQQRANLLHHAEHSGTGPGLLYMESAPSTVSRCPEGSIKEHRSNDSFGSMHPEMRGLIAPVPIRPVGPCHQLEYITSSELASYQQRANLLHHAEHSGTGPGLLYMESAPSTVSRCPEGSIKEHRSNDSFGSMHPQMRGLIAPVPIRPVRPSHQLEYITSSELASYQQRANPLHYAEHSRTVPGPGFSVGCGYWNFSLGVNHPEVPETPWNPTTYPQERLPAPICQESFSEFERSAFVDYKASEFLNSPVLLNHCQQPQDHWSFLMSGVHSTLADTISSTFHDQGLTVPDILLPVNDQCAHFCQKASTAHYAYRCPPPVH